MQVTERAVRESLVETIHIVRPNHLNSAGRLFGGILMQWIDEVAGVVAKKHVRASVITASVDNLNFIRGAVMGDIIVLKGRLTYVGNTSMEIKVCTYIESLEDECTQINQAYLTLVALDGSGKPMRAPRLKIETEEDELERVGGERRREMRKLRMKEGF